MTNNDGLIPEEENVPVSKPQKRPKPMLEGINSPRNSASSPSVGSQTASSPKAKITLPSQNRKRHPVRSFVIWVIVLAGLGYGGYRAYLKYLPSGPKQQAPAPEVKLSNENPAPVNNAATSTDERTATTTPVIILNTSTSTPAGSSGSATATPAAQGATTKQLKINKTETGFLNVRSEPSSAGKIVTQVHPGEMYPYTEVKYQWYNITLPNGKFGWVSGSYITTQ